MHIKIKLSILLLFTCISAFPQGGRNSLLGNVFSSSDKPIPYATVAVYALPDSVLVGGTITDTLGAFVLHSLRAQTYSLRVTCVGYEPYNQRVEVNARQQKLPAIVLSERATNIDEVKVVGDKRGFRREVDMNVFVPDSQAVAMSVNGLEMLKRVPEIRIKPKNNEITVGGNSNVLVLINGSASGRSLQTIKAEDIKKIEVIQNPTAEYDSEVMSVINVVLKDVQKQGFSLSANLEYSFFNVVNNSNIQIDYTWDKLRIFAGAFLDLYGGKKAKMQSERAEREDTIEIVTNGQSVFMHEMSKGGSIQYGFDYRFNEKNIFNFTADYKQSGYDDVSKNLSSIALNGTPLADGVEHLKSETKGDQQNYNAYYQKKFDKEKQNLRFNINYYTLNRQQNRVLCDSIFYADTTEFDEQVTNTANRMNSLNAKLDYAQPIGEKLTLTTGYQLYNRLISNTSNEPQYAGKEQKYNELRNSLYLNGNLRLERFSFNAGLRLEHLNRLILDSIKNNQMTPLPLFSAMYKFNDNNRIRLSYNRRLTYPRYQMLIPYNHYSINKSMSLGNPALKPQKKHTISLDYIFSNDDDIDITPSVYYSKTTDAIAQLSQMRNNVMVTRYENVEQSSSYGVELEAYLVLLGFVELDLNSGVYHSMFSNSAYNGTSAYAYINLSTYMPWDMMLSASASFDGKRYNDNGYYHVGTYIDAIEISKSLFKGKGRFSVVLIEPFIKYSIKFNTWGENFTDNQTYTPNASALMFRFNYFFSKGKKIEKIRMERIRENEGIK